MREAAKEQLEASMQYDAMMRHCPLDDSIPFHRFSCLKVKRQWYSIDLPP
jgi:hypothetical protein